MQTQLFLKNKINRQLQLNGQNFTFFQYAKDKYKQVSDNVKEKVDVCGLFHTTNNYIKNTDSENARLVSKLQPMILMLYEDGAKINKDDQVKIQGKVYKVTEKNDINNFGVAFDISLELVL